jgi:hypothetical protein
MKNTKPALSLLVLSLASAALFAQAAGTNAGGAPAGSGDVKATVAAAAAEKYDMKHWPAGARRAGCDLGELRLSALGGGEVRRDGAIVVRQFANAQKQDVVRVEMFVGDTAEAAHARLLQHVAFVQSTKTLPTAASRGITAGDVGFVGYGNKEMDRIAWLAFVQGNVEFRVVSLDPSTPEQPDLRDAAARLTALAQKAAPVAAGAPLPAPAIELFSAQDGKWAIGDAVRLDVRVKDALGGVAKLDFEVGGTAQGYVEGDDDGFQRFHATKDGHAVVTLFALGSNGVVSEKKLELEIAAATQ